MHKAAGCLLGTVLNAVGAVAILQVTGCSVGVENAQIFWTLDACGGRDKSQHAPVIQMLPRNNFCCSCDLRGAEKRTTDS